MFYFESFFFLKITTLELLTALEAEENVFARKLKTSNAVLNRIEYNFLHFSIHPSIRYIETRLLESGQSHECSECLLSLWSSKNMKKNM